MVNSDFAVSAQVRILIAFSIKIGVRFNQNQTKKIGPNLGLNRSVNPHPNLTLTFYC